VCERTSDHITEEDARTELEIYERQLTSDTQRPYLERRNRQKILPRGPHVSYCPGTIRRESIWRHWSIYPDQCRKLSNLMRTLPIARRLTLGWC
jgi:hypothetical protein